MIGMGPPPAIRASHRSGESSDSNVIRAHIEMNLDFASSQIPAKLIQEGLHADFGEQVEHGAPRAFVGPLVIGDSWNA